MTPEHLFTRYRDEGHVQALGLLFDQLAPRLLLVAARLVDANSAEDVVQSTFLDAIEHRDRWDSERPLMPWLIGLLGMQVRRSRRGASRKPDNSRLGLRDVLDDQDSPRTQAEIQEVLTLVQAEVERLPRHYRRVLLLRLLDGLTVPQIANRLDQPLGTTKTQLHRGLELLRQALPPAMAGALALFAFPETGLAAARVLVLERADATPPPAFAAPAKVEGVARQSSIGLRLLGCSLVFVAGLLALWSPWAGATAIPTGSVVEVPADRRGTVPVSDAVAESKRVPRGVTETEQVEHDYPVRFVVRDAASGAAVPFAPVAYVARDIDWVNEDAALVARLQSDGGSCAFAQFAAVGAELRADASGRFVLPLRHRLFVACQTSNGYGELARIATTFDWRAEQVLFLRPDRPLRVKVVDSLGQALSGVRVRAVPTTAGVPIDDRSGNGDRSSYVMRSGVDGTVTLHNVRHWAAGRTGYGDQSANPEADGCRVELAFPGSPGEGRGGESAVVDVALDRVPGEHVELVAGSTGAIDVSVVDARGDPLEADAQVWLSSESVGGTPGDEPLIADAIGEGRYPHVALDRVYLAGLVAVPDATATRIVGPTHVGEVVRARIRLPKGCLALRGQLVGAMGQPIGGRYRLWLHAGGVRLACDLVVRADGRFCRVLGREQLAELGGRLPDKATVQRRQLFAGADLAAHVAIESGATAACLDLGRIPLKAMPVVAQGVLRCDGEPASAGLACDGIGVDELRIEHRAQGQFGWRVLPCQAVEWLDGSRFVVRALAPLGEHRLVASSRHHLATAPIAFDPGAVGIVVDLVSGADVRAELMLDASCSVRGFGAILRREVPGAAGRIGACDGHRSFVWRGVPAGTYTFELRAPGCRELFWKIEGIEVAGDGSCDDPRLGMIDLRARVEHSDVEVVDGHGRPLSREAMIWNGAEQDAFAMWTSRGRARVIGPTKRSFWVAARGYAPRLVTSSDPRIRVVLRPLTTMSLAMPEVAVGGKELRLVVQREAPGAFDLYPFINAGAGRRCSLVRLLGLRNSHQLGEKRVVTCAAALGETVRLSVWRVDAAGSQQLAGTVPSLLQCRETGGAVVPVRVNLR